MTGARSQAGRGKRSAARRGTSRAIMASALDMCSVADTAAELARSVGAAPARVQLAQRIPVPFAVH